MVPVVIIIINYFLNKELEERLSRQVLGALAENLSLIPSIHVEAYLPQAVTF